MKLENLEALLEDLAAEWIEITLEDTRSEIEGTLSCNSSWGSWQGGWGWSGGWSGWGCRSGNSWSNYHYTN